MAHLDTITTTLKLLADQTRLRLLAAVQGNELTVKELTDILSTGQSTVSTQLGQLRDADLVIARKEGQFVYYRLQTWDNDSHIGQLVHHILAQVPDADWYERDQRQLTEVLERRLEASLAYFNSSKAQNTASPGQTWESVAVGLINLLSQKNIVDLGCGNGRLAARFAQAGNHVIGIDNSQGQIDTARDIHKRLDSSNLRFVCTPAEHTGLPDQSQDIVIISQALHHAAQPREIIREASRILKKGGSLLILDLLGHTQDWIQERFADFWLGFDPNDLNTWCLEAGLRQTNHVITSPDPAYPEIEPLIFLARKT